MKTHKIYKIMLMAIMLFTASLSITSVDAEAKAYKTKTLKVTSGKSKTVKTKKKIKKVKIVSTNKNFTVKKTGNKTFKVSGTDKGKKQTVKVTYKNKYIQKFKIKTVKAKETKKQPTAIPTYAQKIVNELKPLLADPDKGLQTVLADWTKRLNPRDGYTYEYKLYNFKYQLGSPISSLTIDDIIQNYTASQKKALVLEVYFRQRMKYSYAAKGIYYYHRKSNTEFKKLYNGTFKGVCSDGAHIAYDVCQYLGVKANCVGSHDLNHEWCGIYVTDKNGISYWHGINTTSYSYNMKASTPTKYNRGANRTANMSESQVKKYLYSPNASTSLEPLPKRIKNKPTTKPVVTTTQAPVQTPVPQVAPTPKPTPTQTTTTIIFNTPEPPEPEETETPVATTEPTEAPVVTQTPTPAPTQTPVITSEPTPEPAIEPTPKPSETPVTQRIMIPHDEHGYTCPGCKAPNRHTSRNNPYITNGTAKDGDLIVYKHTTSEGVRWFDADGNEYIDINHNGFITDELDKLQK